MAEPVPGAAVGEVGQMSLANVLAGRARPGSWSCSVTRSWPRRPIRGMRGSRRKLLLYGEVVQG